MTTDITADLFVPPAQIIPASVPTPALTEGEPVAAWLREILWTTSATLPRARQTNIGPSQLGLGCSRQIAYQVAGTTPVNHDVDPLPSLVGTAMHAWVANVFRAQPSGRYLVEHRVSYRDVSGTLDLYDRRTHTVVDFKFPRSAKVRRTLADGPPRHYWWQLQTYAAGLQMAGEAPTRVAVAYVPIDAALADVAVWVAPVERDQADDAVDRLSVVTQQVRDAGQPGVVAAQPSRLCPWCPHYRPGWTGDLNAACPGNSQQQETTP